MDGKPAMGMERHDHQMMIADFRRRFYVVLGLTVPIMLLSPMIQYFLGVHWSFSGAGYVLFGLSTAVYFYGGWPFLTGLAGEVKAKTPGMMFLCGRRVWVEGGGFFLGTGDADPHHVAGPLDRNEVGGGSV